MPVKVSKGIYQIHWCIHGGITAFPLSLTDRASSEISSKLIEELFKEKLALSMEAMT